MDQRALTFPARFPNIFVDYPLGQMCVGDKLWMNWNKAPMRLWQTQLNFEVLECYMDWFLSLICKNYIFKYFVKTIEPTSLKFCMIIELITLHLEYTIAQVKYANFSYAHAQTFVLLNGEMATVSTSFRKLKFWSWLLWTVFYLNQTGF